MKKYRPLFAIILVTTILGMITWLLVRNAQFDVLMPTGQIGMQQRNLLIFTVILSLIVVVPVFTMLGVFAWRYREGAKRSYAPEWSHNKYLEALWWGIPVIIIGVLSVVTWQTSHSLDPYKSIQSTNPPINVQVVALQWKWLFIYPDKKVATVNNLTVPVNTPIKFHLTAEAPMSAFWIPSLGSQIYSMNGMSSQLNLIANKQGTFKGYNTNINGNGYAQMTFDADVVSRSDFDAWTQRHSTSGHMLDQMHFDELSKPGLISSPMYMSLEDTELYDKIVMKYMGHGGDSTKENDAMNHKGVH